MAKKTDTASFFTLRSDVLARRFQPIYLLQGEEPYYIDQLAEAIVDTALTEDQKDFNLAIYYGNEVNITDLIANCKQYPVFSDYKVIVLREAQNVASQPGHSKDLDQLRYYIENPAPTTILVICNKGGAIKSKDCVEAIKKTGNGVIMNSDKVRDRDLPSLITDYCSSEQCTITPKATSMMAEFIGSDLSRLFSELDKLKLLIGPDHQITPELIERNIGISKDYNNFELEDALAARNAPKAYRIIDYFEKNPKHNPTQVTVSTLFSFFSGVFLVQTCQDTSQASKSLFRVKKMREASRFYNYRQCFQIIGFLREMDTKSKGIGANTSDAMQYKLLRELVYKILHT